MHKRGRFCGAAILLLAGALAVADRACADVPLGGFTPFLGIGLTRQYKNEADDYFIADQSSTWGGTPLGNGTAYFDIALLDTGSAAHIVTQSAAAHGHFGIHDPYTVSGKTETDGFGGTAIQPIYGATGEIDMTVTDPMGVYAEGLIHRTNASSDPVLAMDVTSGTNAMRGQTSVSILEAPSEWKLPNIIGLPMAAQNGIVIRNSQPQIFQYDMGDAAHTIRTVRTPNVELIALGTGSQQGIVRRAGLQLLPSASFIAGPLYGPNPNPPFDNNFNFKFYEDPTAPTVVDSGGLYLQVSMTNGAKSVVDKQVLLDTGADLTVFSDVFAAKLGLDVTSRTPDFHLEVEGSGGVVPGVPGYYVDNFTIDAVGGPVVLNHVPVAVINVPNPTEPANDIDAILGMHLFTGRDLVIDAIPSAKGNGASPRLYISDPVTQSHTWAAPGTVGPWEIPSSWSSASTAPDKLWIADVRNTTASDKTANVSANSTVFQMNVTAISTGRMTVDVLGGATLTTFGETRIDTGGAVVIEQNAKLDAQFINIQGGTLAGKGTIFVGSGPVNGVVRNLSGRVMPGGLAHAVGQLSVTGDFSNLDGATLAIDLAGTTAVTQYDQLTATRNAFLGGALEVSLVGYSPAINDTFTILTAGVPADGTGVNGQFDNLSLPAGYLWSVMYNANSVVLKVTGLGFAGDLNGDTKVNAADYVFWRKSGGSDQNYAAWRSNFVVNASGAPGLDGSANVPEPCAFILAAVAASGLALRRTRPITSRCARSATWTSCAASSVR